jgi:hypothetical protein
MERRAFLADEFLVEDAEIEVTTPPASGVEVDVDEGGGSQ